MPHAYRLERTQRIPRPLEEVFAFFSDAGNLEAITLPWLNFRILTPRPIVLETGTLIDYQISLCKIPLRWRTRIDVFNPPHGFIDSQIRGPYRRWHHTHEFRADGDGTLMIDRVEYQLHLGSIGWGANCVMVSQMLDQIFDYRYRTIEKILGAVL